jgi:uncharacterized protein (TIGR03435 family)
MLTDMRTAVFGIAALALCAQSGSKPKFDVASVKACKETPGTFAGGTSPGMATVHCQPVAMIARRAYGVFATGAMNRDLEFLKVENGPQWAYDDRWEIAAKSDGKHGPSEMQGPMMQSLLEERFKLKIHREQRPIPVFVLTAAKGGVRLPKANQPCWAPGEQKPPDLPPEQRMALMCGSANLRNEEFHLHGASMADLAYALSRAALGRQVVDRTGVAGTYDIDFKWGAVPAEERQRGDVLVEYQSALAKLGLKLESGTAPGEFLIIDHVERPTQN